MEASRSEEILKTEKSRLLQVAGLAALEIGSTLQWDYEENGKLQDKIVLKFEGKKKNLYLFQQLGKGPFLCEQISAK